MVLDATKPDGDDFVSSLDTYGQETRTAVNLNTVHSTSDGSQHTFIDQSVISGAAPTLLGTNFTLIPDGAMLSGVTSTSAGAADAGKFPVLNASGELDSTFFGDIEITDLAVTLLTASQLLRTNAGGTAVESSGKTVPTGDIVGTTDTQVLAAKVLTLPQINDTSADHQYVFAVSELIADRTVTLPLLTGNDEFTFNAHTQTLTNKTLTGAILTSPILTTPQIEDASSSHQYVFAASEIVADRTITLPILTGNDVFVFADFTQTLTNKTLATPAIASFVNATHDHADAAGGGTLSGTILTNALIDDGDTHVALTSADQTHATPVVTIPDIVDAADTFCMIDTAQTLSNKTIAAGHHTSGQSFANASTPGAVYTDGVYMYAADIVAGNSAMHFMCEDGNIIKLYEIASADQGDAGAMTTIGDNTGTSDVGLSLIGDTSAVNQAAAIMNDFAALKEDINALDVLLSSIRVALIAHGLIKGSV